MVGCSCLSCKIWIERHRKKKRTLGCCLTDESTVRTKNVECTESGQLAEYFNYVIIKEESVFSLEDTS